MPCFREKETFPRKSPRAEPGYILVKNEGKKKIQGRETAKCKMKDQR